MARANYVPHEVEPQTVPLQPIVEERITLLDILLTLLRGKTIIVATTIGLGVVAAGIALLLPIRYAAQTDIFPPEPESSTSSLFASQVNNMLGANVASGFGLKDPTERYLDVLRSRTVAEELIKELSLDKVYKIADPEALQAKLWSRTRFTPFPDGRIRIRVEDKDPKQAALIANGYVTQLYKQNEHMILTEASRRRAFFERQLAAEKNALADAEVDLKKTQMESGVIELENQTAIALRSIADLRAEITSLQVQLQSLRLSETENNPEVVELRNRIATLNAERERLQAKAPSDPGAIDLPTAAVPQKALDYVRKLREVRYHETLFNLLARQYESAKIDESKQAPEIQVLDKAIPSAHKSWPPRALLTVVGLVIGFFLSCFWVLTSDRLGVLQQDPTQGFKLQAIRKEILRGVRRAS